MNWFSDRHLLGSVSFSTSSSGGPSDYAASQRYTRAKVLRDYAARHHSRAEGVAQHVDYGTGVEYDAVCSGCGASWVEDEGGCTERAQLLADADRIERGEAL